MKLNLNKEVLKMKIQNSLKPLIPLFSLLLYIPLSAQIITTPGLNDTLYPGDSCVIKWQDFDRKHKKINLTLYQDDRKIEAIATRKRNWKKFKWNIPLSIKPDAVYRIRLSSADEDNYHCFSEKIYIQSPSIVITEPNSKSKWQAGFPHTVRWRAKGAGKDKLTIQLFRNEILKQTFAERASNRGFIRVSLPENFKVKPVQEYTIKVFSNQNAEICSQSKPFVIDNKKMLFGSPLEGIPLIWMPKEDLLREFDALDISDVQHIVFHTEPLGDERKDTLFIGENVESSTKRQVTIDESVGKWCGDNLSLLLKKRGLKISNSGYAIAIKGVIKEFQVTESTSYKAKVAINFQAINKDYIVLWEGTKTGHASNWGTSYKAINYYECISDAFLKAVMELMKDSLFLSIIVQK